MTTAWLLEDIDTILLEANRSVDPNEAYQAKIAQIMRDGLLADIQATLSVKQLLDAVRSGLTVDLVRQANLGEGASFTSAHSNALRDAVDRASNDLWARVAPQLASQQDANWSRGVQDVDDLLRIAGAGSGLPINVSLDQLLIAQQIGGDLIRRVSNDFQTQAKRAISMGILGSRPAYAVMQDVDGLLRTQPDRQGNLGPIAYQAERIVRTETNAIYSLANHIRQKQAVDSIPEARKQWIAAHDMRTRPDHSTASARYAPGADPGPIPFEEPFVVGGEKMQHPHDPMASARNRVNCRCISVLYKAEWFEPIPELAPEPEVPTVPTGADTREKMLKDADARQSKIAKLTKQFETVMGKYNGVVRERFGETSSADLPAERKAELDAMEWTLSDQIGQIKMQRDTLAKTLIEDLRKKYIYQKPAASSVVKITAKTAGVDEPTRRVWAEGLDAFRRIIGDVPAFTATIQPMAAGDPWLPSGRSYHLGGTVHMSPKSDPWVVVHELGHALEFSNLGIAQSRRAFFESRTKDEVVRPLSELTGHKGYNPEETAKADKFLHAYMGKEYMPAEYHGTKHDVHSEMVSMGVQMLYQDPVKLARDDPGFFDWIFDLLRSGGKA